MKTLRVLLLFALLGTIFASGQSMAQVSPTTIHGATIVTAEQARQAIDRGVPVFDMRTPTEFAEGSVKGAVHLPYKEFSKKTLDFDASQDGFDLGKLPADRAAPMVFYCAGVDCWKSFKAATMAVKAGFGKIMVMRGGWPEWKEKGYPIQ